MNGYDAYKALQKINITNIDFGYVFVDDQRELEQEDRIKICQKQFDIINHFDKYSNFYFPFDKSTHLSIFTYKDVQETTVRAVTFTNNEERTLTSPIEFTCVMPKLGVMSGIIRILTEAESDAERADDVRRKYPNDIIHRSRLTFSEEDDGCLKYVMIVHFRKFSFRNPSGNKIETVSDMISIVRTKQQNDDLQYVLADFVSTIGFSFIYFSQLLTDTKLFVVEERVASMKKGKLKVNTYNAPLFRVIDITTLRKKYIKREPSDGTSVARVGHERRRHTRTFRSDYYKHRQGETIVIEPTWVGPTEHFDGQFNRFYKVRLDIG